MGTVGITACSNGQKENCRRENEALVTFLRETGRRVLVSSCIYEKNGPFSGSGRERAAALMDFFKNPEVEHIYDISGGDMANEILEFLDYEAIQKSRAIFWGYSDLTAVINAIYAKAQKPSVLFSMKNLVRGEHQQLQRSRYLNGKTLFSPSARMVQGKSMEGILLGGNIRCFLKLAGTEYFPDLKNKILLLEARSGKVPQMVTCLSQLKALGAFEKVSGILLGTFCEMEEEDCRPSILSLVQAAAGREIPIAVTEEIGHKSDSKAVFIGKKIIISE